MKIKIDLDEYIELKKLEIKMAMLEYAGVDNWHGWDDALNPKGEPSFRESIEVFEKAIRLNFEKK